MLKEMLKYQELSALSKRESWAKGQGSKRRLWGLEMAQKWRPAVVAVVVAEDLSLLPPPPQAAHY